MAKPLNDYTGQKVGKLTCLERKGSNWLCQCECGELTLKSSNRLKTGRAKHCGAFLHRKGNGNAVWSGYKGISGTIWHKILKHAERRKIPVEITIQDVWEQWEKQRGICRFSGLPLSFHTRASSFDGTASLDRIDSSKPYSKDNIQWVHKTLNIMKLDMSDTNFIEWCKLVAKQF